MKAHPAAALFPMLDASELHALAVDIATHGLREPIVTHGGEVLDGRNRQQACQLASVEPRFTEYKGTDPVGFVISANLRRRHLDASQRSIIAARLATLRTGQNPNTAIAVPTQATAAKLLNVSVDSVQRARTVVEKGVPALVEQVQSGKVAVSAAAVIATLPPMEQTKIVTKGPAAIAQKAREKGPAPETAPASLPSATPPNAAQWATLRLHISRLVDYDLKRIRSGSKSAYACAVRDVRDSLENIARNRPAQPPLFADAANPRGTHESQARNGAA
jgi:hypothetical protein